MTYPPFLREKARELRREKELSIDEIADRLAIGRTTVFHWIEDMPRPKRAISRQAPNQVLGTQAMQAKYRRLREQAYVLGYWEFPRMCRERTFRDFVCLYIAEGYKRCRNTVSIANSDSSVVRLGQHWILPLTRNKVAYSVQYHADQNLRELCSFWAAELRLEPQEIRLQRKSNTNGLAARTWRSKHGVLTVSVGDTQLRARLQGWIDRLQEQWLDSIRRGA
jgi:hypothetical protein